MKTLVGLILAALVLAGIGVWAAPNLLAGAVIHTTVAPHPVKTAPPRVHNATEVDCVTYLTRHSEGAPYNNTAYRSYICAEMWEKKDFTQEEKNLAFLSQW